jgi:CDP-diacylglycerol--serine O-phosphatidyltransferase
LITAASLLFGFWSLVLASRGRFELAGLAIILATVCDMLDGRIARATHSTSQFGIEYDSISDAISFGVAPAFLIYHWALAPLGPRGWLVAAIFPVCAALRLARFNVRQQVREETRYQGLPSTFAGGFVAVTIWFMEWAEIGPPLSKPIGLAVTVGFGALALLMVSSLPYPGLKGLRVAGRHGFQLLVATAVGLVVVLLHHEPVLFTLGVIYIVSGPTLWILETRTRRETRRVEASQIDSPPTSEPHSDAG